MCQMLFNGVIFEGVTDGIVANLTHRMLVNSYVMLGFQLNKFHCRLICTCPAHVTLYLKLLDHLLLTSCCEFKVR